MRTCACR